MNRKNLTAALLAGLAGAAGIAGSAQAVNLNPDGIGSVLIYPYYTVNGDNETLLSVVNTSDKAKAVKVRFMESYNSREVLDFNLYMSAYDVWAAAIVEGTSNAGEIVGVAAGEDGARLLVNDSSCTVPYLYEYTTPQIFLPYAYNNGAALDGGPTDLSRTREGHFEMIEMGTLVGDSAVDATHVLPGGMPADCEQLVDNWSTGGVWRNEALANVDSDDSDFYPCDGTGSVCDYATTDVERNSGGLFGTGAIINGGAGTFYTYDAKAIQGFDDKDRGNHHNPGTSRPSLDSGNNGVAWVFFGEPFVQAQSLDYGSSVDAISAVFMHELIMNEYSVNANIGALSEWVVTYPTKAWYVDDYTRSLEIFITPDPSDPACLGWVPGDPIPNNGGGYDGGPDNDQNEWPQWPSKACDELEHTRGTRPFTSVFDGDACEDIVVNGPWDREESPTQTQGSGPIVSPPPPGGTTPGGFELCYETNVLSFGQGTDDPTEIFGNDHPKRADITPAAISGWAQLDQWAGANDCSDSDDPDSCHQDYPGLVGLPVTGFWALAVQNEYAGGEKGIIANYGGLFGHKSSIRMIGGNWCDRKGWRCGSSGKGG
jgi:hypothetical protein